MIRLLVCDDSLDYRAALRATLAEQPEISIVAEAADGQEAVDLAVALSPDAVLMDVAMPVMDGVEATRAICDLLPEVRVVALTASGDRAAAAAMLAAGAASCCVKGAPLWELERALAGAAEPLVRLAHTLSKSAGAVGAAELVAREIAERTGGAGVAVFLAAPDVGISLAAAAGPAGSARLTSAPGVVLASFRKQRLVLGSPGELAELAAVGLPCDEALAVPLLRDGETLGVVLATVPSGTGLEIDPEIVAAVADLAAAAVANERRIALTHDEARRDALTGLPNRRAFEERLDLLLAAGGEPVEIALLDLDDFKRVNDTHGHQAGDDVLREVARVVSRKTRAHEEIYRLGGDELAVLVSGVTGTAELVANRLRGALAAHRRSASVPTVSGGVAGYPADAETKDELLAKADLALYAAKAEGGDRVVVHLAGPQQDSRHAPEAAPSSGDHGGPLPGASGTRVTALPRRDPSRGWPQPRLGLPRPARVLLVDDDERLRMLLRTTLEVIDAEIDEAADVAGARRLVAMQPPDVVVLDIGLPGPSGLTLCAELKGDARTRGIGIVVLTGAGESQEAAREAGADAYLRKPFSPLDLLAIVERLVGGAPEGRFHVSESRAPEEEQLMRYAADLRRLLELEQGQRALIQAAYRETVGALTSALEAKDTGTNAHSQRVQQYAMELTWVVEPMLLEQPSVEYGFLLHDVGKIGIPDRILGKPGALTPAERRVLETHALLGEQMLGGVALLQGEGLLVVRNHHERWDGTGYPDGLAGSDIPLPARIFAVADALDAMTSDRPYRAALPWKAAFAELEAEAAKQFDPRVVGAALQREPQLRAIHDRFAAAPPAAVGADRIAPAPSSWWTRLRPRRPTAPPARSRTGDAGRGS
jgi:ribonuclease P protein subunit RPR2